MIRFSKEKVLLLHIILAEATGGSVGVRHEGMLDSALEAAFAGFGDRELYPTKEEKGAKISTNAVAKLGRNEAVSLSALEKICHSLDCSIEDILVFVTEESSL